MQLVSSKGRLALPGPDSMQLVSRKGGLARPDSINHTGMEPLVYHQHTVGWWYTRGSHTSMGYTVGLSPPYQSHTVCHTVTPGRDSRWRQRLPQPLSPSLLNPSPPPSLPSLPPLTAPIRSLPACPLLCTLSPLLQPPSSRSACLAPPLCCKSRYNPAACVVDFMLYYEQAIWRVSSKSVRYAPPYKKVPPREPFYMAVSRRENPQRWAPPIGR
jgi:hypothetical protein